MFYDIVLSKPSTHSMNQYAKQIIDLEKIRGKAITARYPLLLPFILESKRLLKTVQYKFDKKFNIRRTTTSKWFNLIEHSSPLYRKYNKKDLDDGKI